MRSPSLDIPRDTSHEARRPADDRLEVLVRAVATAEVATDGHGPAAPAAVRAAWDELAAAIAGCRDARVVAAVVAAVARHLDEPGSDPSAPLVVQQRTFARLHRSATRCSAGPRLRAV